MMLGYELARAGVEVIVLEKHADFFRDFRGDTIHPSTLDLMAELGVLEEFLRLPHTRTPQLQATLDGKTFSVADFRHLPTRCKFIAMMPQWDFLNFIATKVKGYPRFRLEMNANVTDVLKRGTKIVGVRVATEQGEVDVLVDLIVACDGRDSTVRQQLVELRRVQQRREWPVRLMQNLQRIPAATISAQFEPPGAAPQRLQSFVTDLPPLFQRILGRIIGLGFRREHVRTPDLDAVITSGDTSGREQRHLASNR
jgi:2-polyprenyl-6-methoxyphenol hydroxylase-like FAD-dependent oxidoreductase